MLGMPTSAHADPTASDLFKQIDAQWQKLEPTIENYDLVNEKLQAQVKHANQLEKQLVPLSLEVEVKLAKVGQIASMVYMSGPQGTFTQLLNTGATADSLNVLGSFEQLASSQRSAVSEAMKLQQQYEAQAQPVNALIASLKTQQASLDKQKANIQKQIDALDAERRKAGDVDTTSTRLAACPYTYDGSPGAKAAKFACSQIGKKYVWGAAGPNTYDCSGLTMTSWAKEGVSMPHNAYEQAHTFPRVSRSNLKVGDLAFYYSPISHVVIYVGGGYVVSAPTTGDVVRMKELGSPVAYVRP